MFLSMNPLLYRSASNRTQATTTPPLYETFTLVSNLTNRNSQARKISRQPSSRLNNCPRNSLPVTSQVSKQLQKLDDCLQFLKENRKINVICMKKPSQNQQKIHKKKLIRAALAKQIDTNNRQFLEKYLNLPEKRLERGLLQVSKEKLLNINKKTVAQIFDKMNQNQNCKQQENLNYVKKDCTQGLDLIEKRFYDAQKDLQSELRQKIRISGEYLIKTDFRSNNLRPLKLVKKDKQLGFRQSKSTLSCPSWAPLQLQNLLHPKQKQEPCDQNKIDKKDCDRLHSLVMRGSVVDVQVAAEKRSNDLLGIKDSQGNTLFHIAAYHNRGEIFGWLMETVGVAGLLLKNRAGLTSVKIAQQKHYADILKYVPESML